MRWSDDLTAVVECRVHTIEELDGVIRLTGGIAYPFDQLAEVAAGGEDPVWLLRCGSNGLFEKYAQMVVGDDGGRLFMASNDLLRDLPTY